MEIENGTIRSVQLGFEDRNILTMMLQMDFASSSQGFGGYALDNAGCAIFIRRVLEVVGVNDVSKLEGKHVRVRRAETWSKIDAIGHIVDDKWFAPAEDFK